jgi:hypothetical protein
MLMGMVQAVGAKTGAAVSNFHVCLVVKAVTATAEFLVILTKVQEQLLLVLFAVIISDHFSSVCFGETRRFGRIRTLIAHPAPQNPPLKEKSRSCSKLAPSPSRFLLLPPQRSTS